MSSGSSSRLEDASSLADLDLCEEYFVKRQVEGVVAPPSAAAALGQAVHAGLAVFWRGGELDKMLEAALPLYAEAPCSALLSWYSKLYAEKRALVKVLHVEEPFELSSESYGGRPDLVLLDGARLQVVDHKTTGSFIDGAWQEQFRLSEQAAGYLAWADKQYGASGSIEFVIDAIHVPRKGSLVKESDFSWYEFSYSGERLAELAKNRVNKVDTAQFLRGNPRIASKNSRSCFRFNRMCEFFPICSAEPEDRSAIQKGMLDRGELIERTWDFRKVEG